MNKRVIMTMVLLFFVLLTGCTNNATTTDTGDNSNDSIEKIEIKGLEEETVFISLEDIMNIESVEKQMTNISSSGEIDEVNVKGILLDDILAKYNTKQGNYNGIRFYAHDGYSIEVPKEILEKREIILYYEADGQPLDEKFLPLRIAVNDERSMYWVGNLMGIELISTEISSVENVVLLESTYNQLKSQDYTYYESVDQAIKTEEILNLYPTEGVEQIYIESVDGLEKNETIENFTSGYIKIDGEDAPLFLSPDLPKGMHIKNVLYLVYGSTAYISMNQTMMKYSDEIVDDALPLKSILDGVGMYSGNDVIAVDTDNNKYDISSEKLDSVLISKKSDDTYSIKIDNDEYNLLYIKGK